MRTLGSAAALSALGHGSVLAVLLLWPSAPVEGPAPITVEFVVQAPAERGPEAPPGLTPATEPTSAAIPTAPPPPPAPSVVAEAPSPPVMAATQPAEPEPLRPGRKPRAAPAPAAPDPTPAPQASEATTAPAETGDGPGRMAALSAEQVIAPAPTAGSTAQGALPEGDNPPPAYPPRARREGLEGRVTLQVAVAADGTAAAVSVRQTSGHALLDRAAVTAVEQWRFRPASQGGRAVTGSTDVTVRFVLMD
jgi:protein TonB